MDLADVKHWRQIKTYCGCSTGEMLNTGMRTIDWLIAEVERLNKIVVTDNKDWTDMEETLIASRAECEKYKLALEEIDGLYPTTNPPGILLARGIARTALQK